MNIEMLPDTFTLGDYILSFSLVVLGVILNWLQKCYSLDIEWTAYWSTHRGRSVGSIAVCVVAYLSMLAAEQMDPIVYFMVGYMCDSLTNKLPVIPMKSRKNETVK